MPLGSDFAGGLDDWWQAIAGLGQQPTYDTQLSPEQEQAYQAWKLQNAPRDSGADYDLRGAFQAGAGPDAASGHFPDTFKKPNHPTFSNQSQYAAARPDLAGFWQGDNYVPPVAPSGAEMFRGAVIPASKGFQEPEQPPAVNEMGMPIVPPAPGPGLGGLAKQAIDALRADPAPAFTHGAPPIEAIPNRPKSVQELAAQLSAQRNRAPDPLEVMINVAGGPGMQAAMPLIGAARRGLGQQLAGTIESRLASPATSFGQAAQFNERLPPVPARPPAPTEPTGSLNPLDNQTVFFRGKQPAQFTPEDWQAFGQHYGTDKPLGPMSPLKTMVDPKTGKTISIPGGTEGEWTYYDLLHMKANPLNPNEISPELHTQMQQKIGRTMTPAGGDPSDAQVWNGLIFGITSPSNPLTRNQLAQSRLRLRDPKMLDDLASSIPWKAGDEVPAETRLIASKRIADRFGLGAAKSGGLGVRGNADYTRIAELAQMFRENPQFFRKQPGEDWQQAVERISSQVPGLAMKTGSFGTVWQDPAKASVSAIDRHMVRNFEKEGSNLFASPEQRADFESRAIERYNSGRKPVDQVKTFAELSAKPGTSDHIAGMLLEHVGATREPQFRLASGEVNPNIPPHLAQANWPVEPQSVKIMGDAYKRALDLNDQIAQKHGLGLFNSQWLTWDRIRQRFEPHENMFPGLEKTPAPSLQQLRDVIEAHRSTGHIGKENVPTRPLTGLRSPSSLGYLGLAGTLGGASMLPRNRKEEDQ